MHTSGRITSIAIFFILFAAAGSLPLQVPVDEQSFAKRLLGLKPTYVTIGSGQVADPCSVEIAAESITQMEKIGIRAWHRACLESM